MISNRAHGLGLLHSTIQYLATAGLLWTWHFTMDRVYQPSCFPIRRLAIYTLLMAVAFAFHPQRRFLHLLHAAPREHFGFTLRQTVLVFSILPLFVAALKDQSISRAFLFSFFPLLYGLLYWTNTRLPGFLSALAFRGPHQQATVVVGSPEHIRQSAPWLNHKRAYGLRMVGCVAPPGAPVPPAPGPSALPYLGSFCDMECILKARRAAQLIVLEVPQDEDIRFLAALCDRQGVRLFIVNDLPERLQMPLAFMEEDGKQLIGLRQEPLECPMNRLLKRALDLAIALPVVVFILPVVNLAVYLFQRWQAPGPLFFLQRRTGFHNEEFLIYKYRTMRVHSGNEATQASQDDPRVYPAGRWLRSHSIDELPQFLNVLRGEMSIVGPRPHLPEHSRTFTHAAHGFKIRAFIKPGITGLAQVEGYRGEVRELKNLTDRVRSDLYYLENWSLALEWKIIVKTARQLIRPPKSAY
ncbi:MAG: exopolysaccharide biosynthesis polyprenyl glycosylphosphotransferase [Chthoniobacteraceae bacterium]|nr:exopolysaccharide biosynthesis polyprenyl glycosylphosphotransferase [Chthoniobacteraceae bacterium]